MIKVKIPSFCFTEQCYVLNILLGEFLGLEFEVSVHKSGFIEITNIGNGEKLTLNTDFFNQSHQGWLKLESMPVLPLQIWSPAKDGLDVNLVEDCIPVLYGQPGLIKKDIHWHINLDIFGSAFFMLSRYEELITRDRDEHDRFPANASVAYKSGFLDRPIVNEYLEILWASMHQLWPSLNRKVYKPQTFVSCDVDQPYDCTVETVPALIRACAGDILKRKKPFEALKRMNRYVFNKLGVYKFDPNYTFDWYMNVCEQADLKVVFYFIPSSVEPGNGCYELTDKKIIKLMRKIDRRGHEIGVHGSFQTYRYESKTIQQKAMLEQALIQAGIKQKIKGNRQHYLRWDSAITPDILDKAGFEYDTTGSYADHAGFRFGTAHEFRMWGWQENKRLKLKQRPLIVMECTVIDQKYMGYGSDKLAYYFINTLKARSRKYGGNFSLLWHNSYFKTEDDKSLFKKQLSDRVC